MSRAGRVVFTALVVMVAGATAFAPSASGQGSAVTEVRSMTFGGSQRTFRIFAPAAGSAGPVPLVLILHGTGGDGEEIERLVTDGGLTRLAERDRFVAA